MHQGRISSLYRSAVWSLLGTVVPIAAALAAVPFLLHALGQERLGVLSLIWVVVGYFSFLDMGLGRAVTVAVASCEPGDTSRSSDELAIVGTASILLVSVGGAVTVLLALLIVMLGVPVQLSSPAFVEEVRLALLWMLPSLPLLLFSSALRGHLEGVASFKALNLLRMPTGVLLAAAPCFAALYSPELVWACISIFLVRLLHAVCLLGLVGRHMGLGMLPLARGLTRNGSMVWLKRLMGFGGWATVSNVIGPVIVYLDRFVIGAMLTAGSIAAYAVPFDAVSRLPILVASLCSVLLPELARLSRGADAKNRDYQSLKRLVRQSSLLSASVIAVMVALGWVATPYALRGWLGVGFEQQSTDVTRLLILAFGFNSLAQVPFTALQAVGQVRTVALVHASQLLPYCAILFAAVSWLGVLGAAWAWLVRSAFDYGLLVWMWHRHGTPQRYPLTHAKLQRKN